MDKKLLGDLITNLWGLETVVRRYLVLRNGEEYYNLDKNEIGDLLNKNYFTDYSSLEPLIDKYNNFCEKDYQKINKEEVLDIRDLLAHARVHIVNEGELDAKFYLVKFSKSDKLGRVKLINKVDPNKEESLWLKESIKKISLELRKVSKT